MIWLRALVVIAEAYLLLSLGCWFALRYVQSRLYGGGRTVEAGKEALGRLAHAVSAHAAAWPREPRPGRYAVPDQLAGQNLATLRTIIAEAETLRPSLRNTPLVRVSLGHALCLRAVAPMWHGLAAWRDARALWRMVDRGDAALAVLVEQNQVVQEIPARTRATLNEVRAEVGRLGALLEAVQEEGMLGLDEVTEPLNAIGELVSQALDALSDGEQSVTPQTIHEIDRHLRQATPVLQRIDRLLNEAAEARNRAQSIVARVYSALRLAEERWEAMRARGATERSMGEGLAELRSKAGELPAVEASATFDNYQQLIRLALALDTEIQGVMMRLDRFEETIRESKERLGNAQQAMSHTIATYQEVAREDDWIHPDRSEERMVAARDICDQAEWARGRGTQEGYQSAMALADRAMEVLTETRQALESLPGLARETRALLAALSQEVQQACRERFTRVCAELQNYPRHWKKDLAAEAEQAATALKAVAEGIASLPEDIVTQRKFRESQLAASLEVLSLASQNMTRAEQRTEALEGEHRRLATLRHDLEAAIADIADQTLPALLSVRAQMLPDLQQQLDRLIGAFESERPVYLDPARVDYDEVHERWLPVLRQQIEQIATEHRDTVLHYQRAQRDVVRRIDRLWARLQRLDPYQAPCPAEDMAELASAVETWRAAVEAAGADPGALREHLGREVKALERRLEMTIQEIEEGRARIDALSRDYARSAENNLHLAAAVRNAPGGEQWPSIVWGTEEADEAWQVAVTFERESHVAQTMAEAVDRLQRAVNAARHAENLRASIERYVTTAVGRLHAEAQALTKGIERARRVEAGLRQDQRANEAQTVAALLASAERALEAARQASTVDEAMRHLRAGRAAIDNT